MDAMAGSPACDEFTFYVDDSPPGGAPSAQLSIWPHKVVYHPRERRGTGIAGVSTFVRVTTAAGPANNTSIGLPNPISNPGYNVPIIGLFWSWVTPERGRELGGIELVASSFDPGIYKVKLRLSLLLSASTTANSSGMFFGQDTRGPEYVFGMSYNMAAAQYIAPIGEPFIVENTAAGQKRARTVKTIDVFFTVRKRFEEVFVASYTPILSTVGMNVEAIGGIQILSYGDHIVQKKVSD